VSKLCRVIIDSSASTKLTTEVYDFELPVLGEIHGPEKLTIKSEREGKPICAEDAFAMLTRKYQPLNTDLGVRDPVRQLYHNAQALSDKTGLKLDGSQPVELANVGINRREAKQSKRVVAKAQQAA
jgi:hypothetical protein